MISGAGRRRREFFDWSHVRTCAQATRGLWMPTVPPLLIEEAANWIRRQPYSRMRKPRTASVSASLTPPHPSRAVTPCRPSTTKSSASRIDPHGGIGLPVTVTTAAGKRPQNLVYSSMVRTNAPSCADIDSSRGPVPHIVGCESHIRQPRARVRKLHTSCLTAVLTDTVTHELKHGVSRSMKNTSLTDLAESAPSTRRYLRPAIRPCRAICLATSHRQPQFPGDATCANNK